MPIYLRALTRLVEDNEADICRRIDKATAANGEDVTDNLRAAGRGQPIT